MFATEHNFMINLGSKSCYPSVFTHYFCFSQLERMEYPSKYIDIVKSNDLSGSALVFGNVNDLKNLLGMNFGEWTTFQLHFLGLRSHHQPQYKNMPWMLPYSQKEPSRFPLHVPHHYSSNTNLINSTMQKCNPLQI